jgi:NO-binding membrane sensor protein with MHYT domain
MHPEIETKGTIVMAEIHHLSHGWVTPTVSYVLSVLGSLLGLVCAVRLRKAPTSGGRIWWLSLAAVAIGGTGIWTMHFVAMLGFDVVGSPIRYDVGLTAASAVIAVVAVGIGLSVALLGSGERNTGARNLRILIGGMLAGLGVAAMHYTGMAAMRLDGTIDYASSRVALSVAIAVVAATVALWLTMTVTKPLVIMASAMIMGVAVNGMHFTGMSAMSVQTQPPVAPLAGATASQLLIPIGLAVVFGVLGLIYSLMAAPTEEDRAGLAYISARQQAAEAEAQRAAPASRPTFGAVREPAAPPPARPQPVVVPAPMPQQPPVVAPPPQTAGPTLGERLGSLQRDLAEQEEAQDQDGGSQIPGQRLPRRMPTTDSSWTFRDRAKK